MPKRSVWSSSLISNLLCLPKSNSKFKLVSRKCTSREGFCLVGVRLCQLLTILKVDRLLPDNSKWPRFSNLPSGLLRPFSAAEPPPEKDMASASERCRSDGGSTIFDY